MFYRNEKSIKICAVFYTFFIYIVLYILLIDYPAITCDRFVC